MAQGETEGLPEGSARVLSGVGGQPSTGGQGKPARRPGPAARCPLRSRRPSRRGHSPRHRPAHRRRRCSCTKASSAASSSGIVADPTRRLGTDGHGRRLPKKPCHRCGANVGPLQYGSAIASPRYPGARETVKVTTLLTAVARAPKLVAMGGGHHAARRNGAHHAEPRRQFPRHRAARRAEGAGR